MSGMDKPLYTPLGRLSNRSPQGKGVSLMETVKLLMIEPLIFKSIVLTKVVSVKIEVVSLASTCTVVPVTST